MVPGRLRDRRFVLGRVCSLGCGKRSGQRSRVGPTCFSSRESAKRDDARCDRLQGMEFHRRIAGWGDHVGGCVGGLQQEWGQRILINVAANEVAIRETHTLSERRFSSSVEGTWKSPLGVPDDTVCRSTPAGSASSSLSPNNAYTDVSTRLSCVRWASASYRASLSLSFSFSRSRDNPLPVPHSGNSGNLRVAAGLAISTADRLAPVVRSLSARRGAQPLGVDCRAPSKRRGAARSAANRLMTAPLVNRHPFCNQVRHG